MNEVQCIHRWQLESPNGTPFVSGRCSKCGEERQFSAAGDIIPWGDQPIHDPLALKSVNSLVARP